MYYKLNIKSLDKLILQLYIKFLKILFLKLGVKKIICVFMPKKKKRVTILRSSHVHKKSREQFQITCYKACIFVKSSYILKILHYLLINKPKNVKISILHTI